MEKYLIGIDVGTTGTKALLFNAEGGLVSSAYRSYPLSNPNLEWSEQSPSDWWQAIVETVREICSTREIRENVTAIALSTQGGTLVPTDENGKELSPAIVWNDYRCTAEKEEFQSECGGDPVMYQTTGWHLGRGLPALAIRWLKKNKPDLFSETRLFLSVHDYVSMKMTGIPAVDLSNAGINQLCDINKREYNEALLRFSGVEESQLARLVPSSQKIGTLTEDAASELGLTTKVVFVSGAHDQYAVALGAGAMNAGDILIGSGTCWVVTALSDRLDYSRGLSQSVSAVTGLYGSLQSLSSGGVCLDWLRKNVVGENLSYKEIDDEAERRRAGEGGLFFYPFSGKRRDNERFNRGSFVGMDLSHDKFDLCRAVMEGVVFQILWMSEGFELGDKRSIILAGGASKSPVWSQLLADASGLEVRVPEVADLACVGAAIMAGVGAGVYKDAREGFEKLAVRERILTPRPEMTAVYREIYKEYKAKAKNI